MHSFSFSHLLNDKSPVVLIVVIFCLDSTLLPTGADFTCWELFFSLMDQINNFALFPVKKISCVEKPVWRFLVYCGVNNLVYCWRTLRFVVWVGFMYSVCLAFTFK